MRYMQYLCSISYFLNRSESEGLVSQGLIWMMLIIKVKTFAFLQES